jgi:hypothetical protein
MKNELPTFSSEKELAEWIGSHDTSPYMDDLEVVAQEIPIRRTPLVNETLGLLLNPNELDAIKRVAERKRGSLSNFDPNLADRKTATGGGRFALENIEDGYCELTFLEIRFDLRSARSEIFIEPY